MSAVEKVLAGATIRMVDVVARVRQMYGDNADLAADRPLPVDDWRFEMTLADGTQIAFRKGATADYIADYLAQREVDAVEN